MRALVLVAGAALTISACGSDQAADNVTSVEGSLAAQNIAANDTTGIDAATGDDANMAADINFTVEAIDNEASNAATADNSTGNRAN